MVMSKSSDISPDSANIPRSNNGSFTAPPGDKPKGSVQLSRMDPNAHYNLPADPWVIHVRWKMDGMYPPGTVPPGSTHSSMIDLRRQSVASLSSSAGGSVPTHDGSPAKSPIADPVEAVTMHLDIQLYEMEHGVYLVDFKCAGYETADGKLLEEKDVTSPFPFLDLASKLIIQLAEAD